MEIVVENPISRESSILYRLIFRHFEFKHGLWTNKVGCRETDTLIFSKRCYFATEKRYSYQICSLFIWKL